MITKMEHVATTKQSYPFISANFKCRLYELGYRRKTIYKELRADIGYILRRLCEQKGVEIIEANACPDHIHMRLSKEICRNYAWKHIKNRLNLCLSAKI